MSFFNIKYLNFSYTETDSRPLTPAPTLSSSATKASGSRRCFTPDPIPISTVKEKTMLVLDLRRSHSQVSGLYVYIEYVIEKVLQYLSLCLNVY